MAAINPLRAPSALEPPWTVPFQSKAPTTPYLQRVPCILVVAECARYESLSPPLSAGGVPSVSPPLPSPCPLRHPRRYNGYRSRKAHSAAYADPRVRLLSPPPPCRPSVLRRTTGAGCLANK
eukprot:5638430-Pyramimonas_sp.AAC.1